MAQDRSTDDREQKLNAHLTRAGELLRGDQLDAAEKEIQEALRVAPDDVRAQNLLGLARFRAGRYEDAHRVYRELVARDPEDAALRLNLGLVELRLGRNADASTNLRKVIDKEPQNTKAQGYLGLALMRAGEFGGARVAFVAAGQTDLARQAEEQLRAAMAGGSAARTSHSVAARLEGEMSLVSRLPQAPSEAPPTSLPQPVAAFLDSRELRPGGVGEPFSVEGDLLVVRVDGRIPMRTIGAIASSGRLGYTPVMRRLRGKASEEPFGDGEDALVIAAGKGTIVLSPRGGRFTALALGGKEVLYVRETMVLAFEESLYWENGRIPGSGAQGMIVVQFRGEGRVVLRSKKMPWTIKVTGGDVLYVDQEALLGWVGDVVPQQLRGVDGEPTQFIACSGEGSLLIEEPPPPQLTIIG